MSKKQKKVKKVTQLSQRLEIPAELVRALIVQHFRDLTGPLDGRTVFVKVQHHNEEDEVFLGESSTVVIETSSFETSETQVVDEAGNPVDP